MEAWLPLLLYGGVLSILAVLSLSFTLLEPRNPTPPTLPTLGLYSLGSSALVYLAAGTALAGTAMGNLIAGWAMPVVIGWICGPAIVPPCRVTKEDEPDWFARQFKSLVGSKFDAALKAVVIGIPGLLVGWLAPISDEATKWFVAAGVACVFSILSRPISRADSWTTNRWTVEEPDFSPQMWRRKAVAAIAQVAWLALIFPVVLETHGLQKPLEFLVGVFIGFVIADDIGPALAGEDAGLSTETPAQRDGA